MYKPTVDTVFACIIALMIVKAKKRTLLLIGMMLTSILSFVGGVRGGFLKGDSLLVKTAHADIPPCSSCGCTWTQAQCDAYFAPGGACFPKGTMIDTPFGTKEIQDCVAGDIVYGYVAETGERVSSKVTATTRHAWEDVKERSPLLIITHEKGRLSATANHWIYRKNDRQGEYANFDRAGMLAVGDVLTMANGEESRITKIEDGPEYDFVYDISVEEVHTYFADGVMVHNLGDGGGGDGGCCGSK